MIFEPDTQFLTAVLMLGVAWAFVRADPRAGTSRALALAFAMAGIAILCNQVLIFAMAAGRLPLWARLLGVPEVIAFCAVFEWVLRVRRTIPAGRLRTRAGDVMLRIAQALVVLYGVNGFRHPELRMRDFYNGLAGSGLWSWDVMSLFVAPLALALLLWVLSLVLCLNRDPAPAERVRLIAFLIAIPLIAAGLVLPTTIAPLTTVIGISVMLAGALRHAELRGRQGQFMSRFLSPQVVDMVNRQGLREAMREERRELSIVAIDLRGFTAFTASHGSDTVIALLRAYYDAVGATVLAFEGTIKDYAGDGVLVLIGAPVAVADHAARAVALSRRLIVQVPRILAEAGYSADLGVGVGIASGEVTVGIVGGEGPLEYAAVGSPVNLAARLCEQAAAGEILIAAETRQRLNVDTTPPPLARAPFILKGFDTPVTAFALAVEAD